MGTKTNGGGLYSSVQFKFFKLRQGRRRVHPYSISLATLPLTVTFLMLVLFLLPHFSSVPGNACPCGPPDYNLNLPVARWAQEVRGATVILVDRENVIIEGENVGRIDDIMEKDQERDIADLSERLLDVIGRHKRLHPKQPPLRSVVIAADREMRYGVLKKILWTCTQQGLTDIQLAVESPPRMLLPDSPELFKSR